MRRFKFGLQTVLKVRQTSEERLKLEYASQSRRLADEYHQLEALLHQVVRSESEARAAQAGRVDVTLEKAYYEYLQALDQRIKKTRARIATMETELRRQQALLVQARRAVKVLEKLREKRWSEYHRESQREELKRTDDLTLMRRSLTSGS